MTESYAWPYYDPEECTYPNVIVVYPFLTIFKVQLNVNVETTVVSQIDEDKDHYDMDVMQSTLPVFDEERPSDLDRDSSDREDEKYPPIA